MNYSFICFSLTPCPITPRPWPPGESISGSLEFPHSMLKSQSLVEQYPAQRQLLRKKSRYEEKNLSEMEAEILTTFPRTKSESSTAMIMGFLIGKELRVPLPTPTLSSQMTSIHSHSGYWVDSNTITFQIIKAFLFTQLIWACLAFFATHKYQSWEIRYAK